MAALTILTYMSIETWGLMPKSQVDDETIEQAIARILSEHGIDPNSHMGSGEALDNHRQSDIIDHKAGSIVADKIAAENILSEHLTSGQIIGKDFRTAENVGELVDGVKFDSGGIEMWQGGDRQVNIPISGDAEFHGDITVERIKLNKPTILFPALNSEVCDLWGISHNFAINGYDGTSDTTAGHYVGMAVKSWGDIRPWRIRNPKLEGWMEVDLGATEHIWWGMGTMSGGDVTDFIGFYVATGHLYTRTVNGGTAHNHDLGVFEAETRYDLKIEIIANVVHFYVNGEETNTMSADIPANLSYAYLFMGKVVNSGTAINLVGGTFFFQQDPW